jgi:hypothetical protein
MLNLCDKLLCAIRNRLFADCIQRINARDIRNRDRRYGRREGMGSRRVNGMGWDGMEEVRLGIEPLSIWDPISMGVEKGPDHHFPTFPDLG